MLARRSLLLVSLLMVDGAMARGGTLVLTPTDQEMAQVSFPPYQLAPPFMGYLFTSFNPGPGLYEAGVEYDITPLTLPPQRRPARLAAAIRIGVTTSLRTSVSMCMAVGGSGRIRSVRGR